MEIIVIKNGHVTAVVSLMEGKWSCLFGQFNGGSMVILQRWLV